MAELKTQKTKASVAAFIASLTDEAKRKDAKALLSLMKKMTGEKPAMWGESIIGFGSYHYESARSSQSGDWPLIGFSPRKTALTLYIMPGFSTYEALLTKLGKHKTSVGCLYIKKLADVDLTILEKIIERAYREMKKKHSAGIKKK